MKKNVLLSIAATALLFAAALSINDGWIYSAAALSALIIITVIRHFHSRAIKITRWAKENPRKTQLLITAIQIIILSLGLLIGWDLKELGYKISYAPVAIFGVILLIAFLYIPFLSKKRNLIALPASVNKDRLAYMAIAVSAFVVMISTGNRIEDRFPNSPVTSTLKSIDKAIFQQPVLSDDKEDQSIRTEDNQAKLVSDKSSMFAFASIVVTGVKSGSSSIDPNNDPPVKIKHGKKAARFEKRKMKIMKQIEKLRKVFASAASVGVILLIILLVLVTCIGICLAILGGTAGAVIGGIAIAGLAIFGIVKLAKGGRSMKNLK